MSKTKNFFKKVGITIVSFIRNIINFILKTFKRNKTRNKIKSYIPTTILVLFVFFIIMLGLKYNNQIKHFIFQNNQGNLDSVFTALGASILGSLAVIILLSIFTIQQASQFFSSVILWRILKNKKNVIYFILISIISITFFIFAVIPNNNDVTYYLVLIGFILIILFFYLIWQYYKFSIQVINPYEQLNLIKNKKLKQLYRFNKGMESAVKRFIALEHKGKKPDYETNAKLIIFKNNPGLLYGLEYDIDQIFNIIETYYLSQRDYKFTKIGFNSLNEIIKEYLIVRQGTFEETRTPEQSRDPFLTNIYEKYRSLSNKGIEKKDEELLIQIIDSYVFTIINCLEIKFSKPYFQLFGNEYFIIANGYMQQIITNSLNRELYDIGLSSLPKIKNIGLFILDKRLSEHNFNIIIENLFTIAKYGIMNKNKAFFLTQETLEIYSFYIKQIILNFNMYNDVLIKTIFGKSAAIINGYIRQNKTYEYGKLEELQELTTIVGNFLDYSKKESIPTIFSNIFFALRKEDLDIQFRKSLLRNTIKLSKKVRSFYDDIITFGAEKNSIILSFINNNVKYIIFRFLDIYKIKIIFDKNTKKEELLDSVNSFISIYFKIIYSLKKIESELTYHGILEDLLEIGIKLKEHNLQNEYKNIISNIIYIAERYTDKNESLETLEETINIIKKASLLVILDGSLEIRRYFYDRIEKGNWKITANNYLDFIKTNPEYDDKITLPGFLQLLKILLDKLKKIDISSYKLQTTQDIRLRSFEKIIINIDPVFLNRFIKDLDKRLKK